MVDVAQSSRTVAQAMVTDVTLTRRGATVRDVRALFGDEHVHAAVVVHDGALLAVVDRADVGAEVDADVPAVAVGRCEGRVIGPSVSLPVAHRLLDAAARRRLAVVADDGTFLGLLCLKRTRNGFCSDADVLARRLDPH